ncbi:hypothetical protein P618_200860 [Holospora obtusa F1]|uniref:Uncharacterized protein n=1 Tax=Holospora obtusa F1 TaxID=1399147 RepID=W6TT69_HOLOB|nr:hypothetical protein [Holospora obtusa]ETZ06962.1 hypothetical protein P618_200860 [Holospora obtusa F1]
MNKIFYNFFFLSLMCLNSSFAAPVENQFADSGAGKSNHQKPSIFQQSPPTNNRPVGNPLPDLGGEKLNRPTSSLFLNAPVRNPLLDLDNEEANHQKLSIFEQKPLATQSNEKYHTIEVLSDTEEPKKLKKVKQETQHAPTPLSFEEFLKIPVHNFIKFSMHCKDEQELKRKIAKNAFNDHPENVLKGFLDLSDAEKQAFIDFLTENKYHEKNDKQKNSNINPYFQKKQNDILDHIDIMNIGGKPKMIPHIFSELLNIVQNA